MIRFERHRSNLCNIVVPLVVGIPSDALPDFFIRRLYVCFVPSLSVLFFVGVVWCVFTRLLRFTHKRLAPPVASFTSLQSPQYDTAYLVCRTPCDFFIYCHALLHVWLVILPVPLCICGAARPKSCYAGSPACCTMPGALIYLSAKSKRRSVVFAATCTYSSAECFSQVLADNLIASL